MRLLRRQRRWSLQWLQIDFDREVDELAVRGLMLAIVSHRSLGRVVFEAVARQGQVSYRVGAANELVLRSQIGAALPNSVVHRCERAVAPNGSAWVLQANTRRRPLVSTDLEGASRRWLSGLAARPGMEVIHQITLGRRLRPIAVPNNLEDLRGDALSAAVAQLLTRGTSKVDPEARRALAAKQGLPGAEATVRLLVAPADRHTGIAHSYLGAVRGLESPGLRVRLRRSSWRKAIAGLPSRRSVPSNAEELLALLAWPYGESSYPGVNRSGARLLLSRHGKEPDRIIGTTSHPGRTMPLGQRVDDALRHLHVLGPTGTGKSTLLLNLILQDVAAGRAAVVLDPKGDLVEDVLARVPAEATDRLVVLDAARTDHVVGFNPLQTHGSSRELAVDGLLHIFSELHARSWGPRTQDILHNSLLSLIGTPYASLYFIPHLLGVASFRRRLLAEQDLHATVRFFWSWFDGLSEAERSSVIAPLSNKLRPFLLRASLRSLVGQVEPHFDPQTVFTDKKVLLVPLHKGLVGAEATNLLGSLVVSRLWQLALQRSAVPTDRRHPVFVYLDEFQDYLRLPTDLADVLAQARGLGLGLVLAHQHLGQLTSEVKAAVLANAQSRICFRLGDDDARLLARSTAELEADDFQRLGRYEIYAKLLSQGEPLPFASAQTMEPPRPTRDPQSLAIRLAERWGRAVEDVDTQLSTVGSADVGQDPIGRKRRRHDDEPPAGST